MSGSLLECPGDECVKDFNIDFDVNLLSNNRSNNGVSSGVTGGGFKVRAKKRAGRCASFCCWTRRSEPPFPPGRCRRGCSVTGERREGEAATRRLSASVRGMRGMRRHAQAVPGGAAAADDLSLLMQWAGQCRVSCPVK